MPQALTVNGITYQYPKARDKKWGQQATAWAAAVTGVVSHLRAPTPPLATVGQIRLGNLDTLAWRNAANLGNITLTVNALDELIYDDGVTQKNLSLVGGGNLQNPGASIDNTIPRFDGVSNVIQTSNVTIDDSDNVTTPADVIIGASGIELSKALTPIGTIIPHYDFNAALAPDSTYWVPCIGQIATIGGVSRTLPDMSNRYLVGFGTEGGQDNDSAAWSTTPVGAASHQINLQHTHTIADHTHTINSSGAHNHIVLPHVHTYGSLTALIDIDTSGSNRVYVSEAASPIGAWNSTQYGNLSSTTVNATSRSNAVLIRGQVASGGTSPTEVDGAHTHSANNATLTPANSLSATQSIQPRSISVRWYMRAK